jgi:hypothetical protein
MADSVSPLYSRTRSRSSKSLSASPWLESTLTAQHLQAGSDMLELPATQAEQSIASSAPAVPCRIFSLHKSDGRLFLNMLSFMLSRAER